MTVKGFSRPQRQFFLNAFNFQCGFYTKVNGKWIRCLNTENLEIHHIMPRGFSAENMPRSFDVNNHENGMCLCRHHHHLVHPDTKEALKNYAKFQGKAFKDMMANRRAKNIKGQVYWNTEFDLLFIRLNKRFVGEYLKTHEYPK